MNIEDMTIKQARELAALFPQVAAKAPVVPLPFAAGDKILIRTVTMFQLGVVKSIGRDFIVLEDGGWLADTGRFGEMLANGTVNELERAPDWFLVGRGAIVDVFPWKHAIPKASK